MEKANDTKKKVKGFVVMGVRDFCNGEHHWLAPSDIEEARAFGEQGEVTELEGYEKPVFESMTDAEHYAMSLAHGEYTLAQWETGRPTWYVVDVDTYLAIVERDNYSLPKEAELWGDAKAADFERECDCEDIVNLALWDSETDKEKIGERTLSAARELDYIDGMSSWVVEDGEIAVTDGELTIEGIRDFVDNVFREGTLGCNSIEFDRSEGKTAYFKVK